MNEDFEKDKDLSDSETYELLRKSAKLKEKTALLKQRMDATRKVYEKTLKQSNDDNRECNGNCGSVTGTVSFKLTPLRSLYSPEEFCHQILYNKQLIIDFLSN